VPTCRTCPKTGRPIRRSFWKRKRDKRRLHRPGEREGASGHVWQRLYNIGLMGVKREGGRIVTRSQPPLVRNLVSSNPHSSLPPANSAVTERSRGPRLYIGA
jgi:hypothetical protein